MRAKFGLLSFIYAMLLNVLTGCLHSEEVPFYMHTVNSPSPISSEVLGGRMLLSAATAMLLFVNLGATPITALFPLASLLSPSQKHPPFFDGALLSVGGNLINREIRGGSPSAT